MDKYDKAIEYLKEHPDQIDDAWYESIDPAKVHPAHCLFMRVTPTGYEVDSEDTEKSCGCLTQIRKGIDEWDDTEYVAWTLELTEAIRSDSRIPASVRGVTLDNLEVFAEWQRKIDTLLQRS